MANEVKIGKPKTAAWVSKYNSKVVTADEAVKIIKSGDKIVVQPGCAAPFSLINAMVDRKDDYLMLRFFTFLL